MNQTSQAETRQILSSVTVRPSIVIRPLDPVMGAEVIGLDVSRPLSTDTKSRLEDAFNEYKLLCFRDQILTTDSLVAFTRNWGVPGEHTMPGQLRGDITDVNIASNADANGKPNGIHPDPTAMRWHTDRSWRPDPVTATLLYGVEVPSEGGDTLFCNTAKAYDALPEAVKRRIDSMKVIHSVEYSRLDRWRTEGDRVRVEDRASASPPLGARPSGYRQARDLRRLSRLEDRRHAL